MTDPLSAYIHRSWLVDGNGAQSENVNKVAIYYWDTVGLAWTKATGGAVPGANVNVTNFPASYSVLQGTVPWSDNIAQYGGVATSLGQKAMASSMPVTLASDQSTVSTAGGTTQATDKTLLTKTIMTGMATDGSGYVNGLMTTDGGTVINQNTVVDAASSTTANLAGGATFTGPATPDLNYTAVQYSIKSDQNCTVYIDQSPDGTNWDISDSFNFNAPAGSGNTVQLVASYYRIRVTNTSLITSTYLRLQVIKVPFLPSLPRSLDADGHLAIHGYGFTDSRSIDQYLSPNGEVVAVPLYKLIGDVFTGSAIDPNFWTTTLGTGGSATIAGGQLTVDTGTTANNAVEITSVRTARFTGLAPNKIRIVVQLPDTGIANNLRHWGMGVMGASALSKGCAFQMNGTSFELVLAKLGVITTIANGTFNGQYGLTFNPGLNSHFYEIVYQPRQVIWLADNKTIHTFSASAAPWTEDLNLPIHIGNVNSGGLAQSVTMALRIATVARFGIPETQPTSAFIQRTTVDIAQNLKNTPGNLHGITISGVANNAVITLYNNTTATGSVLWSSGAMTNNTFPFDIPGNGVPFSVGLSIGITGAAASAWVKYE